MRLPGVPGRKNGTLVFEMLAPDPLREHTLSFYLRKKTN
jgi:hypothetical protein